MRAVGAALHFPPVNTACVLGTHGVLGAPMGTAGVLAMENLFPFLCAWDYCDIQSIARNLCSNAKGQGNATFC